MLPAGMFGKFAAESSKSHSTGVQIRLKADPADLLLSGAEFRDAASAAAVATSPHPLRSTSHVPVDVSHVYVNSIPE
jgi:hypothetical protein